MSFYKKTTLRTYIHTYTGIISKHKLNMQKIPDRTEISNSSFIQTFWAKDKAEFVSTITCII